MRFISIKTGISCLFALLLGIPLSMLLWQFVSTGNTELLIPWFAGFFVIGCFPALLTRSPLAIFIAGMLGLLVGMLSTFPIDVYILHTTIINLNFQHQSEAWTLLVLEIVMCMVGTFTALVFSVACSILGWLLGFLLYHLFRAIWVRL